MRSIPEIFQGIMDDKRKRELFFKGIWMASLGMLVLGYFIIVLLLV
ncbi:MAG: hypothetical protein PHW93_04145 [Candidatus Methanomethylophilaceae archaeon]|nr:hypothetical protein [Candidatus Methanomethylophilaceae archaeon]